MRFTNIEWMITNDFMDSDNAVDILLTADWNDELIDGLNIREDVENDDDTTAIFFWIEDGDIDNAGGFIDSQNGYQTDLTDEETIAVREWIKNNLSDDFFSLKN